MNTKTLERRLRKIETGWSSADREFAIEAMLFLAERLFAIEKALGVPSTSVVHMSPEGDAGTTDCCDRTVFQLPRTDRMTNDRALVTCNYLLEFRGVSA